MATFFRYKNNIYNISRVKYICLDNSNIILSYDTSYITLKYETNEHAQREFDRICPIIAHVDTVEAQETETETETNKKMIINLN